ncbi:MAG: pilus assembly PilX N-terminal domain-containing protein, partial [Candidatus Eremiobacteraeota bacterium]|nr:pilus assembly PilX N-terminal domain-containing protein [Candidatus Eremiobacteraeota bacterium]
MRLNRPSRKGSILVTLLFMTSILALLVAAVATDSFQSMKTVGQSSRDTQAKYAAYAGLEIVLNELRKDEYYIGEDRISDRHGTISGQMQGLDKLKYEVFVWNNIQERNEGGKVEGEASDIEGPDGILVRPDTVYIVSSGSDTIKGEEVLLTSMAGTARRIRPVFDDAAFARTKLMLTGMDALVDAWDSAESGSYVSGDFPGETGGGGGGGG